ncbi:MAG TPA: diacylglycerol kinase family protein [Paracoccaceae bacterium]|nr:diacylglycerol kinase family protein [Paracoccaceae bacterium]
MRLGVLRNPASTGNRGRTPTPLPAGAGLETTEAPADCAAALRRLCEAGAEAIVIDGGDGTVRAAATAAEAVFGEDAPPLGILPRGNSNLIARRLGAVRGTAGLARLAAMTAEAARSLTRPAPALRFVFAEDGRVELGFVAGWGVYAAGRRIGAEEIAVRHGAQIAAAVFAAARRSLVGPEAARLRAGVPCRLSLDGAPATEGPRFAGVITTLPGRLLGPLDPFWGGGEGPIRWTDVAAPPRRLALALPFALTGRPRRWMEAAGYRSGRASRLDLRVGGELVVDGEVVAGSEGASVAVTTRSVRMIAA